MLRIEKYGLILLFVVLYSVLSGYSFFANDDDVAAIVSAMSVEQKVGQLFMIGNLGRHLTDDDNFSKYHFGNIFFGYDDISKLDAVQITQLTATLQALAQKHNAIPLLIATDQEGGRVNRVKKGVTAYPDQEQVASKMSIAESEAIAFTTAQQLGALGINTNFSPVVDVNTNKGSLIGTSKRAFSDNPQVVSAYGAAYLKGYRAGKVIGCAKHFPGYGDVTPDPHKSLSSIAKSREEMHACEWVPYKDLIASSLVDMIMTAHILTPSVTGDENVPATISKNMIQGILRDEMKYDGVVVTDDFNMGAMTSSYSIEEQAVMCINAGVDIILWVGRPEVQKRAWEGVHAAVRNGTISQERLNESVMRVLKLKKKYGLLNSIDVE